MTQNRPPVTLSRLPWRLLDPDARHGDRSLLGCRPSTAIAAELHTSTLGSSKRGSRASADHASLKLGNRCHLLQRPRSLPKSKAAARPLAHIHEVAGHDPRFM
jgi:hypothetical protein